MEPLARHAIEQALASIEAAAKTPAVKPAKNRH
jgi:hypothetical protein